jgi:hypothetical protein
MSISELRKNTPAPQPRRSSSQPVQAVQNSDSTQIGHLPNIEVGLMNLQSFELVQRAARLLAASTLVPKEYQNNLPNCVIALNMAQRMNADPLMVMQNLYLVHGRPSWSAQFLIATFNQCGRYNSIKFEWQGSKGAREWGCRAYATERATGERIESAWITWGLVEAEGWSKRAGSKWLTIPDQMFMYRAASWLVRAYAPELSMGLHTAEENLDRGVLDVEYQNNTGTYVYQQQDAAAAAEIIDDVSGDTINAETGEIFPGEANSPEQSFNKFHMQISNATSIDEIDEIVDLSRDDPSLTKILKNKLSQFAVQKTREIG